MSASYCKVCKKTTNHEARHDTHSLLERYDRMPKASRHTTIHCMECGHATSPQSYQPIARHKIL